MNPEDSLRDALSARAGAARTSPDALDGVFTRVARHRRRVRAATAAGAVLSVVAVALVADAAVSPRRPDRVVTSPTVPVVVSPTAPTATPGSPAGLGPDSALVAFDDGRMAVVSTTTGRVLHQPPKWDEGAPPDYLAWSPGTDRFAFGFGCLLFLGDLTTGEIEPLGDGTQPAFSPDGSRLAYTVCDRDGPTGVGVYDLRTRRHTTYPTARRSPGTGDLGTPGSMTWLDGSRLLVTRYSEAVDEAVVLEVDTDDELADGEPAGISPEAVAGDEDRLVWMETCCHEEAGTTKLVLRDAGTARTVFERAGIYATALDGLGRVLFADRQGVWRLDGSRPVLVVRGAVLLAK